MVTISDISSHTDPALGAPVLACLDFSEDSKSALIWACKFAESNGIPLVLLHVVHDIAAHPGFYKMKKSGKPEPMLDIAESMLDEFLDQVRSQHPELEVLHNADVQLVPGLPPTRIIEVAGLLNASLIRSQCMVVALPLVFSSTTFCSCPISARVRMSPGPP